MQAIGLIFTNLTLARIFYVYKSQTEFHEDLTDVYTRPNTDKQTDGHTVSIKETFSLSRSPKEFINFRLHRFPAQHSYLSVITVTLFFQVRILYMIQLRIAAMFVIAVLQTIFRTHLHLCYLRIST